MVWFPGDSPPPVLHNSLPAVCLGGGGAFAVPASTCVVPAGASISNRSVDSVCHGLAFPVLGSALSGALGLPAVVALLVDVVNSGLVLGIKVLLDLSGVAVEEEIDRHVPFVLAGDAAAQAEHLTGKEPVHKADGVAALVVDRDGNVNVLEGGVRVAQSNDGDVHVGGLLHGLVVRAGVGDDEQAGLLELLGDLVGEGTRGEASSDGGAAGELGELEHGALAVGAGRDGADVGGVLDGSDDAGGEHDLVPGLGDVEDVDVCVEKQKAKAKSHE